MNKVFAYHQLENSHIRKKVLGREVPTKLAHLENHIMKLHPKGYDTVIPLQGHIVTGKTFMVTDSELEKLDEWEARYERKRMRVNEDGNIVGAFVYKLKSIY